MKSVALQVVGVFFLIWGLITVTINAEGAFNYRLQNATIAALVNRGTFTLKELEVPDFRLIVGQETFRISEDIYPMKQPGQTIYGALIYYPMKKLGINFDTHYMYASQLVTMFSSAFLSALAAVIIGTTAWELTKNKKVSLVAGISLVFGTTVWAYAGVTHHDIFGLFLITLALHLYIRRAYFVAGFVASMSLFFTMLALPLPFVLLALNRRLRGAILGTIVGLLPTLIFNWAVFGRAWLVPNIAGKVSDTVPLLSITNFLEKLWFYLGNPSTAIWAFAPITIFGMIGIIQLKRNDSHLKNTLLLPVLAQIAYVSSIETFGGYQYGPRYLILALPFLIIGVALWLNQKRALVETLLFSLALLYSTLVAGLGAVQSVMVPINEGYEPYKLLLKTISLEIPVMRVWKYGAAMIALGIGTLALERFGIRGKTKR